MGVDKYLSIQAGQNCEIHAISVQNAFKTQYSWLSIFLPPDTIGNFFCPIGLSAASGKSATTVIITTRKLLVAQAPDFQLNQSQNQGVSNSEFAPSGCETAWGKGDAEQGLQAQQRNLGLKQIYNLCAFSLFPSSNQPIPTTSSGSGLSPHSTLTLLST